MPAFGTLYRTLALAGQHPATFIIFERRTRRLFAGPARAIYPSVDTFADQALDAWHVNVICFVLDRDQRYRCPDLLDFGDHLDGIWKPLDIGS